MVARTGPVTLDPGGGTVGLVLLVGMVMLALGRDAVAYLSWLPVVPLLARELETGTHRLPGPSRCPARVGCWRSSAGSASR
jgi:hypothetical protein